MLKSKANVSVENNQQQLLTFLQSWSYIYWFKWPMWFQLHYWTLTCWLKMLQWYLEVVVCHRGGEMSFSGILQDNVCKQQKKKLVMHNYSDHSRRPENLFCEEQWSMQEERAAVQPRIKTQFHLLFPPSGLFVFHQIRNIVDVCWWRSDLTHDLILCRNQEVDPFFITTVY